MNLASAWGHSFQKNAKGGIDVTLWLDGEVLGIVSDRKELFFENMDTYRAVAAIGFWAGICNILSAHVALVAMEAFKEGMRASDEPGTWAIMEDDDDD